MSHGSTACSSCGDTLCSKNSLTSARNALCSAESSIAKFICQPCILERHHAHPEHELVADVNVVLAHERELAVVSDAECRKPGRARDDLVTLPHIHRQIVLCHEQASARVDVEGARMYFLRLDVLDQRRLARCLIDRVHGDAVLAALEHLLALVIDFLL